MPCTYSYLQDNFYNRIDGAVSKTVALKEFALEEFDNKVEGSSPSKTFFFFFFFFFCFRKYAGNFSRFTCLQTKHVLM